MGCDADDIGIQQVAHYTVRLRDLASIRYLCLWLLGIQRKPCVIASARLLWLCELVVMPALPGMSLGVDLSVKHLTAAGRGSAVTVIAECTKRRGHYWEWTAVVVPRHVWTTTAAVAVHDYADREVIARCTLGFVADVDVERYTARHLAPALAGRRIGTRVGQRVLDALGLILVMAIPVQVTLVWHGWISMLVTETVLIVGWLVTRTGLPSAVCDWVTVRPVKDKDASARYEPYFDTR